MLKSICICSANTKMEQWGAEIRLVLALSSRGASVLARHESMRLFDALLTNFDALDALFTAN